MIRECNTCGEMFPFTGEYFPTSHGKPNSNMCRQCTYKRNQAWRNSQSECPIEGCTNKVLARGLCGTHYKNEMNQGRLERTRHLPYRISIGYSGLHQRIKAIRGLASSYQCECGNQAEHWALDHTKSKVWLLVGESKVTGRYSSNPYDYKPMCIPCHRKFDAVGGKS